MTLISSFLTLKINRNHISMVTTVLEWLATSTKMVWTKIIIPTLDMSRQNKIKTHQNLL
jgi:hypothetical protein